MASGTVTTALIRAAATLRNASVLPIDAKGLAVVITIPPGVDLLDARLEVQAPGEDVTVDLVNGPPAATLSADVVGDDDKAPAKDTALRWYTLDWGARRPLCVVNIQKSDTPAGGPTKASLQVADAGPWYSPLPGGHDEVALNVDQELPGIMARRLMLRFESPGIGVSSVLVKGPARPCDLSVSIGESAPFFHRAEPMDPLQSLTLHDELARALRQAWPADLAGGEARIVLRSSGIGALSRLTLTLDTAVVTRAGTNGAATHTLTVPTDGRAGAEIEVPGDGPLESVEFTVAFRMAEEQISHAPAFPHDPRAAQLCEPTTFAAQGFPSVGAVPLAGVDLHARALTRAVSGTFAIHPDASGRPADVPFPGAVGAFELVLAEDPPWASRWLPMDLPKPVAIGDKPFWVVLAVTSGSLLWNLRSTPPDAPPGSFLARMGAGPWLPRARPWAYTRLRMGATAPPPPPTVRLGWGSQTLPVQPDARGRVTLGARALSLLPVPTGPARPPLEILFRSKIGCEITISDIRITSRHVDAFDLFPTSS